MADASLEHRIRVALGRAFHHKHKMRDGSVDIEHIASEHGVSEDQVMEQFAWLRNQGLIDGPLNNESRQIGKIPAEMIDQHHLTGEGLNWAETDFPFRQMA